MAKVVLQNLLKLYPEKNGGSVAAVNDIGLTINDGEFMVLVGPSGCGKSSTLRMIAGLEEISGGNIAIDGRVVNDLLPKDRDIAMVFQNYALYPHMTVRENMEFGLKLRKVSKPERDQRVQEAATLLGLGDLLERRPKALSGGQRQRVAVGRAIVRQPKVFLFDEPLSNLDAKMRVTMRAELSKLHARLGATMIYVTHDQVEAMTMGDRICVMKDGRIQQVATPLELYHHPANVFVAGFIGSPAMNFFPGSLRQTGDTVEFIGTNNPAKNNRIISLPPQFTAKVGTQLSRPVILGIRPEDVREAEVDATVALDATLELAEPMGAETYLHLSSGTSLCVSRVRPRATYVVGQRVNLAFDLSQAHLFDAESGLTLASR